MYVFIYIYEWQRNCNVKSRYFSLNYKFVIYFVLLFVIIIIK